MVKSCSNCLHGSCLLSNKHNCVLCINEKMRGHRANDFVCEFHEDATPEQQAESTDKCIQSYVDKGVIIRK